MNKKLGVFWKNNKEEALDLFSTDTNSRQKFSVNRTYSLKNLETEELIVTVYKIVSNKYGAHTLSYHGVFRIPYYCLQTNKEYPLFVENEAVEDVKLTISFIVNVPFQPRDYSLALVEMNKNNEKLKDDYDAWNEAHFNIMKPKKKGYQYLKLPWYYQNGFVCEGWVRSQQMEGLERLIEKKVLKDCVLLSCMCVFGVQQKNSDYYWNLLLESSDKQKMSVVQYAVQMFSLNMLYCEDQRRTGKKTFRDASIVQPDGTYAKLEERMNDCFTTTSGDCEDFARCIVHAWNLFVKVFDTKLTDTESKVLSNLANLMNHFICFEALTDVSNGNGDYDICGHMTTLQYPKCKFPGMEKGCNLSICRIFLTDTIFATEEFISQKERNSKENVTDCLIETMKQIDPNLYKRDYDQLRYLKRRSEFDELARVVNLTPQNLVVNGTRVCYTVPRNLSNFYGLTLSDIKKDEQVIFNSHTCSQKDWDSSMLQCNYQRRPQSIIPAPWEVSEIKSASNPAFKIGKRECLVVNMFVNHQTCTESFMTEFKKRWEQTKKQIKYTTEFTECEYFIKKTAFYQMKNYPVQLQYSYLLQVLLIH